MRLKSPYISAVMEMEIHTLYRVTKELKLCSVRVRGYDSYLKKGTGYAWASHKRAKLCRDRFVNLEISEAEEKVGAFRPTGSGGGEGISKEQFEVNFWPMMGPDMLWLLTVDKVKQEGIVNNHEPDKCKSKSQL